MPRAPAALKKPALPVLSFRAFLEDASFCNLELSPAMAAIADASEGRRVTLPDAECVAIFGCPASALPTVARRTVAVSAGGRGGKSSRLLAPKALHAACTVPLPDVRARERGRSVLIAPDKDLAEQDLDYVRGYAEESEIIKRWLLPSPKTCVRIRRPDGTVVDIRVGAANRGGRAARARSLVFCGLEESAFFFTDSGHAVSDKEIYRAATQRVVPGGQVWIVSTPWIAEEGILEERIKADLGKHAAALVVARVGTRTLNPRWDHGTSCPGGDRCVRLPDCGAIESDMRSEDPENAAREIDAIPFAAGTSTFFDPVAISRCFEVAPFVGAVVSIGAGADFGFTSDCTTAALARSQVGDAFDLFDAHERRPTRGEPLKPSEAVGGAARFVLAGGARSVAADGHYKESVREHLDTAKVGFIEAPEGTEGKVSTYTAVRKIMNEGRLRVSIADPDLRRRMRDQFRSITKKQLPGGGIQISAPRRKNGPMGGTTHGDLVSAGVLALWRAGAGKMALRPEDQHPVGIPLGIRGGLTRGGRGSLARVVPQMGTRCAVTGCLGRVPVAGMMCGSAHDALPSTQ